MLHHDLEVEADYRRGDLLHTARVSRARRRRWARRRRTDADTPRRTAARPGRD